VSYSEITSWEVGAIYLKLLWLTETSWLVEEIKLAAEETGGTEAEQVREVQTTETCLKKLMLLL
jgi:hypothetical protein